MTPTENKNRKNEMISVLKRAIKIIKDEDGFNEKEVSEEIISMKSDGYLNQINKRISLHWTEYRINKL